MRKTNLFCAIILLFIFTLPAVSVVYADMGPKPPSLLFDFIFSIPAQKISGGELHLCKDKACNQYETIELVEGSMNIRYSNEEGDCWLFIQGQSARYYRLRIKFADITRESNVFAKVGYDSAYIVEVNINELSVQENSEKTNKLNITSLFCFLPVLILTITIEIAANDIFSFKWAKKITMEPIVVVNVISFPIVWFIVPLIPISYYWLVMIAEFIACGLESFILHRWLKKEGLNYRNALVSSIMMNACSLALFMLIFRYFFYL